MSGLHRFFRFYCIVIALALPALALGGCDLAKNQLVTDRSGEKDLQDYRDVLSPQALPPSAAAGVPEFRPVVSTPSDLKLPAPLVTVSVNQTVSLRDLMFELAEQAGVDLEMDPQIRGSLIFTAKDRPFNDVIERICEMSGLRYKFANNVLRIELDRPFLKDYKVDYMNVSRKSSSSINNTVSVTGAGDTASGGSGSSADIKNSFEGDFWKEIDTGLKQVLTSSDTYVSLATLAEPMATPMAPPPPPIDPNNPNAPVPASTTPPTLNVSVASAPSEPLIPSAPATYSVNKQSGLVTVFASERQHKLVKKFLDTLRHISTTQILIEAKVFEVGLTDQFSSGIDWGTFNVTGLSYLSINGGSVTTPAFTGALNLGQLRPVIQALSTYGTVRTLSSPRVTVMNNQPAVVNVAENKVYFNIKATSTTTGSPPVTTTTFDTTQKTLPEGVLMNVVPTANPDTGEVILAVRPTVTKQIDQVEDPSIQLNAPAATVQNFIPVVSVQEIDSIVKIQSGQTVVMGGLMRDGNVVDQSGVPILGDVPMLGALFRSHTDNIVKKELVILLKATIVPGANADEMDRKLYKSFSMDRRPAQL